MDFRTLHLLHQFFLLAFSALNTFNHKTFRELQSTCESICGCFRASRMGFQGAAGGALLGEQTTSDDLYNDGAAALIRTYYAF